MAMPLYDLIKKGVIVKKEWNSAKHGKAVQELKDALTSRPVLMQIDNTKPYRLKIDACRVGRGIGCILEQQNARGKWQPVSYFSSSLSKAERNYSATELECKALHDCILHYSTYLKYIPHFEVFSDHNALRYMVHSDNAITNGRLMRYLLALQEYNFTIYYRKGTENCDADAVSRLTRSTDPPIYATADELDCETGVVTRQLLQRARAQDSRNKKTAAEARRLLHQIATTDLQQLSHLHDLILAEGVENLESETGRHRFLKNVKDLGVNCSEEYLEQTVEEIKEDRGEGKAVECSNEEQEEETVAQLDKLQEIVKNNKGLLVTTGPMLVKEDEALIEDYQSSYSGERLPLLLSNLVQRASNSEEYDPGFAGRSEPSAKEELRRIINYTKRKELIQRCSMLVAKGVLEPMAVLANRKKEAIAKDYNLRKRRIPLYQREPKLQPNWKERDIKLKNNPITEVLADKRRRGWRYLEVKESLVPGESGWGLFATKKINEHSIICGYEGPEIPLDTLQLGYSNTDYVAGAIRDHRTQDMVFIDAIDETGGFGRFAQDPIDEHLVNAKILWKQGKMVVVSTNDIDPGDEVYVEYGLEYWKDRIQLLHPDLQKRIARRVRRRSVEFHKTATVADIDTDAPPSSPNGLRVRIEGEPILKTPDNYLTRVKNLQVWERTMADSHTKSPGIILADTENEDEMINELNEAPSVENPITNAADQLDEEMVEALSFENVNECEELADDLQFLNGRKFIDEDRLYEIWQVRYDPEFQRIIGFRRPMSGKTHREDGSAFLVFGRDGLYELSELYLLHHPEERDQLPWPKDSYAWAKLQDKDSELKALKLKIKEAGGYQIKEGKHKYSLVPTRKAHRSLLIREVMDHRKGALEQTVVPTSLKRLTLKMHHEGYGHMGANRMLETIRLRYFWIKMDEDISKHTNSCINCKLRKSYQRRPKVPIMKYDDTARPLDRVHVDLTGPLPTTKLKNKYILVVKDYITKYVWLIPLRTKGAQEVAEALVGEVLCQIGMPGRIVSDRGNEFVNQLLTNISKVMGINRISTTPYNPRADGFVENHNKTLKDQLFHFIDPLKQDDWDVFLPTVQLMYNTTVSLATGYTPMLLLTGREARMPSFNHMQQTGKELYKDLVNNKFVMRMIETMRGYQDFALQQTLKNKERLNQRVRQPLEFTEYEPGQQFFKVRRPISQFKSADEEASWKISMKLLERFEGPYKILRKLSPVLYDADVDGVVTRVHANNMKPY